MPGRVVVVADLPHALVANHGNRCTLVCAATLLRFAGAGAPGPLLAERIGQITGFNPDTGPPALAYLAVLGSRPLLDVAIEQVAAEAGLAVQCRTRLIPPMSAVVRALDVKQPVIFHVVRAPSGIWSHSIIAYGYRYGRSASLDVLIADPNQPGDTGEWAQLSPPWTLGIVTATFVRGVGHTRRRDAALSSASENSAASSGHGSAVSAFSGSVPA